MKLHRGKRTDCAGYALVLFVMIFFGLMGLAALVIDMGFARLARRQMQTSADSAALEGLRWRDSATMDPRQQASNMAVNVFDDDLNPGNGDPMNFGAGPIVQFQGGNPTLPTASQQLIVPVTPVYKPTRSDGTPGLELNSDNAPNGDMVAGTYSPNGSYDPLMLADENAQYDRRDFAPTTSAASAFLVRMRRTNDVNSLDHVPGVSSAGPALPVLFGRGSLMAQSGGSGQLSVASGITVRATAIAAIGNVHGLAPQDYSVGRVKVAGRSIPSANIPGITPFALTRQAWHDGIRSVTVDSTDGITLRSSGGEVGKTISPTPPNPLVIGEQIGPEVVTWPLDPSPYQYVPIYSSPTDTTIIGFGYVDWHIQPDGSIQLTPGRNRVAYGNATAGLATAIPAGASSDGIAEIFRQHAGQPADPPDPTEPEFDNSLYAPVLVSHYIGPQQSNP